VVLGERYHKPHNFSVYIGDIANAVLGERYQKPHNFSLYVGDIANAVLGERYQKPQNFSLYVGDIANAVLGERFQKPQNYSLYVADIANVVLGERYQKPRNYSLYSPNSRGLFRSLDCSNKQHASYLQSRSACSLCGELPCPMLTANFVLPHPLETFRTCKHFLSQFRYSTHFMKLKNYSPHFMTLKNYSLYPEPDKPNPSLILRFILILSFHTSLNISCDFLPSDFPITILYAFLFSPALANAAAI